MQNSFWEFIKEKPLFYKEIDHERVHKAYALLKLQVKQPLTIHVVGTNGKGSTGRIMASLLQYSGTKVGHFSSPHILKFNERIWIEGEDISDKKLEEAHEELHRILGQAVSDELSYFEYTTLLALVAMQDLEVIVLEAGLGGEFDATNVCSKALSVITPIGLDHQDFLGNTIEEIATTKMNSIDKEFVLALQSEDEVYAVAQKIILKKKAKCYEVKNFKEKYPREYEEVKILTEKLDWSEYLFENALTAFLALKKLDLDYKVDDLEKITLFGRFYKFSSNVTIDVGHNLLATRAIVKTLEKQKQKNLVLIYNTLKDKDHRSTLKLFKPYLKRVELIEIESERSLEIEILKETLTLLNIKHVSFKKINEDEVYLVFGSFYVLEAFLNKINNNLI